MLVFQDEWWTTGTDDLGNFQDDMAMLANSLNGFGLRADDHAGSIAGATPLVGSGTNFSGSGVIGVGGDVDVWSLTTSGTNSVQVKVEGSVIGQNLDAVIDFLDSAGNVILTANPTASNDAELIVEATGTQYIVVRSTGEYGRVGGYTVSVTESQPGVSVVSQSELYTSELGISDTFSLSLKSKPTADVLIDISSSDSSEGTVSPTQLVFTSANWYLPQAVTVRGTEDSVVDGVVAYAINLGPTSSADVHYNGVTLDPIAAVNADNDVPGWAFELKSTEYVLVTDLEVAADGSLFVTGTFSRTTDFNPGPATTNVTAARISDAFIAKYSPSQELLWVRPFGTAVGTTDARSIDLDSAGNLYVVGYTSSSSLTLGSTTLATRGSGDAFAAKLNNDGNFVWAKSWGSTGDDSAYSLFIDANDRLHVGGYYSGTVDFDPASTTTSRTSVGGYDAFVSRLDSNGNFLSVTSFGGVDSDFLREVVGDTNGNVFAAGYFSGTSQFGSHSLTSAGGTDSYLCKLNAAGSIEWAHQAAGIPSGTTSPKLAVTSSGDVFFSGSFTEDVNFGPGTTVLSSAGLSDVFLTKWSTDGNLLQAGQLSGPASMGIAGLKVDATDQPVVYGYFAGTVDMDPTSETVTRTSLDAGADFILRLDANTRFCGFLPNATRRRIATRPDT